MYVCLQYTTFKTKLMKNLLTFILILVFISGFCVISCPDKEAHSEAIMENVNNLIDGELTKEVTDETEKALVILASSLVSGISNLVIDSRLSVDNYFLFSIGKVTFDGESNIVSIGLLNHVFTDINDNIKKEIEERL